MAQNSLENTGSYSGLSRAQLTVEYLHTNSTTHEFLFGALAELVDNARDAGASRMDIYSVPNNNVLGKFLLCFCDDGDGMDPTEVSNVIQFGRSTKRVMDSKMVGQYGNGLKSGSMRIGKDMILFTKKQGTMSCLFLSRTFHEREGINEVVVPIPSWHAQTKKPFAKSKRELEKHEMELQLILKYSPFRTTEELFEYFDRIGEKGTLVVIYNLKLLDSGETELEVSEDDIRMRELYEDQIDDKSVVPERKSFRSYTAILYLDPRMKIYIQGKKVATRRLGDCLYKPKSYHFSSKRFKTRSEHEASKAMVDARSAADKARELENVVREMQEGNQGISKEDRAKLRQAQDSATQARTQADMKSKIAAAKQKSLKEPKTLTFTFGFNINRRNSYGLFIYNCNRLIKMYEKGGFHSNGRRAYTGIVGFVDVPYLALEPTHNKQDFADAKEYKHLLRSMGDHLGQYWKDSGVNEGNVDKFWDNFGYISNDEDEQPSNEPKYLRKRAMQLPCSVQCVKCLKWRILPFSAKNVGKPLEDEWVCSFSTEPERNTCSAPEQKSALPVGYLQKQIKTAEEKQKEILEDIKKKQEKLGQLNGRGKPVHRVEEKQEERPVKRVPPRSVPQTRTEPKPAPRPSPKPVEKPTRQVEKPVRAVEKPVRPVEKPTKSIEKPARPVERAAKPVEKPDKPAAKPQINKVAPIARQTSKAESTVNRSAVGSSNKREHPVVEHDANEVQPKRKRNEMLSTRAHTQEESHSDSSDVAKSDDALTSSKMSKYKVSCKVDVNLSGRWYAGKVVAVKHRKNAPAKVKVKFDHYQKDKYDKWFDETDANLKLFNEDFPVIHDTGTASPPLNIPASSTVVDSPPAADHQEPMVTDPPSSTGVDTMDEPVRILDKMLRTCICYMLVPDFPKTADQVQKMTLDELKRFRLDELFRVHGKSIQKIMENKSKENKEKKTAYIFEKEKELHEVKQREAECKTKLSNLRRTAAKLIRSLNENPEESSVGLNEDTDRVDALLEAIAEQASESDVN